jgi:hypothetical protein
MSERPELIGWLRAVKPGDRGERFIARGFAGRPGSCGERRGPVA